MCTLDRPAEFLGLNSTLPSKMGAILQKILSIDHSNDFAHCQSCLADLWCDHFPEIKPQLASSIELGTQISNMGSPSVMIILP